MVKQSQLFCGNIQKTSDAFTFLPIFFLTICDSVSIFYLLSKE